MARARKVNAAKPPKRKTGPEALSLSEADRIVFFDTLASPPEPNARLRRALREANARIEP